MADIVSPATRRAFQESYVGWSILREISNDFDDVGVRKGTLQPDEAISGERRTLVEQYYRSVDWSSPSQVRRVLDAFELHLLRLQEHGAKDQFEKLIRFLTRDKLLYKDDKIVFSTPEVVMDDLVDRELGLDVSQLRINIARIRDAVEEDPDLAIGSSKELVEATCKTILADRGVAFPSDADIPKLVFLVADNLRLVAANVTDEKKGVQSIKRVLGSLSNIVQGLAELRNLYGSGHGKSPGQAGLSARHARLCAGSAATLAMFLMETAKSRSETSST